VDDAVRTLITAKLGEKGLTMREVSLTIGRNDAYVQQFIKRGLPAELGEREREALGRLLGVSPDDLRGPNSPRPHRMNGGSNSKWEAPVRTSDPDDQELLDRCRVYQRALRKIAAGEPKSAAAEIARAALLLFE
jgi:hypothetical protein